MTRPRTYAAITRYSLERVGPRVKAQRLKRGLSVRGAAREIGVVHQVLVELEQGGQAKTDTLVKVFAWLDGGDRAQT